MDTKKLNRWAELLLDTGKRNNLVNFKDTKASSVEVLFPNTATLFSKAENSSVFEVYDPKLADDEDELEEIMQDMTAEELEDLERYAEFILSRKKGG